MPYKCGFGCDKFNPLCDACDAEVTSQEFNDYDAEFRDKLTFKAAVKGLTLDEYLLQCDLSEIEDEKA